MKETLIKKEYPLISEEELLKIKKVVAPKCCDYFFVDFLRSTNGNVDDAISLFFLDEKLRSLFVQYLMRFEIQIKSDFATMVENSTLSDRFWVIKKFYIPEARNKRNGKISFFEMTKENI